MSLHFRERRAAEDADGLLVLHHGRGSHELDLLGLADLLDPEQRLHVVTPRAPMVIAGAPGYHWYHVRQVGFPDQHSFHDAYRQLCDFHDQLWSDTGIPPERTILGGFSMGTVMSFATALGHGRPDVAGVLGFSGFLPTVDGWEPDLGKRESTRVMISHGAADPVIGVGFGQRAAQLLEDAGFEVEYHEGPHEHSIIPQHLDRARGWLAETLLSAGT